MTREKKAARAHAKKDLLHPLPGMLIKKASGRCGQHQPDGHGALYALPHVTRFDCFYLRPRPVAAGRGPLFYLHPGRATESQAKERQQQQDKNASHGGRLLYPFGSMRRVSAWSEPRNEKPSTLRVQLEQGKKQPARERASPLPVVRVRMPAAKLNGVLNTVNRPKKRQSVFESKSQRHSQHR